MKIRYYLTYIFLCVTYLINAQQHYLDSAKVYISQNQFTKASIFYERILYEPFNEEEFNLAIINKIECLKKQKLFANAANFIKSNIRLISNDSVKYKVYEQWVLCCYLTNQLDEGISLIEQSKAYFPKYCNVKWLDFFKILFLNEQQSWIEAKNEYKKWLVNFSQDTASLNIYDKIPTLKSEKKAKALATLLPGSGLFYTNHYIEGFTSILLQGICLYYGLTSFQEKYYLSTWLVGLGFCSSFYSGSIRRTEVLIKQYNLKASVKFNENTKRALIEKAKF